MRAVRLRTQMRRGRAVSAGAIGAMALFAATYAPAAAAATNGVIAAATATTRARIVEIGATNRQRVVPGLPADSKDPAWSTDGATLAFSSTLRGKPDIYVVGPSGRPRLVTIDDGQSLEPTWSPDGREIAFARLAPCGTPATGSARCARTFDIYVIDLASGVERRLTTDAGDDRNPAWSPDGALIAYENHHGRRSDVWVMAPDGSGKRDVTAGGAFAAKDEANPAWSPDGSRLVFSSGVPGSYVLDSLSVAGGDVQQLTIAYSDSPFPASSPDGTLIAFSVGRDLREMPAAGAYPKDAQLLARGLTRPAWAPARLPGPAPDLGVPVIDAAAITLGTKIDATNGVLLTFRPRAPGVSTTESTAMLEGGTFELVSRTSRMPTLRLLQHCVGPGTETATTASGGVSTRTRRTKPAKASAKANGDFRLVDGHITAGPQGTTYALTANCSAERVAVAAGVVDVTVRMGARSPQVVRPGHVAIVRLVYGPHACAPPSRSAELSGIGGSVTSGLRARRLPQRVLSLLHCGQFNTTGRFSSATVRG